MLPTPFGRFFCFIGFLLWTIVPAHADALIFDSTQLSPVSEANKMRNSILKDFEGEVDFQPNDNQFRHVAGAAGLLGGMHGDFTTLIANGALDDVGDLLGGIKDRDFSPALSKLGQGPGGAQAYIPWMQATYLMAANRTALAYLPEGADVNQLTYDQLATWGEALKAATGKPRIGLPLGVNGLLHRFLQGYVLPSYTGGTVRGFNSIEAREMWRMVRRLWDQMAHQSTDYSEMGQALLNGDAWVVWDHTARLKVAFDERPGDFIAFPAPSGPKGRAFMAVVAGLAIPKNSPDRATAAQLIDYLTRPEIQLRTLREVGFFPVIRIDASDKRDLNPGMESLQQAVSRQSAAQDALAVLLPLGLGDQAGAFNTVYRLTFTQIVLRGRDVNAVLTRQSQRLGEILNATGAPCWLPDRASDGPCPIE